MHFQVNTFQIFFGKGALSLATPAHKNITLSQIIVSSRILHSSDLKVPFVYIFLGTLRGFRIKRVSNYAFSRHQIQNFRRHAPLPPPYAFQYLISSSQSIVSSKLKVHFFHLVNFNGIQIRKAFKLCIFRSINSKFSFQAKGRCPLATLACTKIS